jgi:Rod binding domain-containing protein
MPDEEGDRMQIGLNNRNEAEGRAATTVSPRLMGAAQEFEAQMMKELLTPLTERNALTGEEPESGGDAGAAGTLGAFASEALGQAISRRGGFGIANHIMFELSRSGHPSAKGKSAGSVHEKNTIRTAE